MHGFGPSVAIADDNGELASGTADESVRTGRLAAGRYLVRVTRVADSGVYRLKIGCNARAPLKLKVKSDGCNAAGGSMPVFALFALALLGAGARRAPGARRRRAR